MPITARTTSTITAARHSLTSSGTSSSLEMKMRQISGNNAARDNLTSINKTERDSKGRIERASSRTSRSRLLTGSPNVVRANQRIEVLGITRATSIRANDSRSAVMATRRSETRETARSAITVRVATPGLIAREGSKVWKDGVQVVPEIALALARRRVAGLEVAPVHVQGAGAEVEEGAASALTSWT